MSKKYVHIIQPAVLRSLKFKFIFNVNYSAVKNDRIYLFLKSAVIRSSVSTTLLYDYVISLIPWMKASRSFILYDMKHF